jgi:hypothetical protein
MHVIFVLILEFTTYLGDVFLDLIAAYRSKVEKGRKEDKSENSEKKEKEERVKRRRREVLNTPE